ncbi:hypothetical protein, partial [Endozoicomonas sp. SESOKO3]|uniref:hypothetical protein n=1 Tax=Endozoicomonas sp. SESOKO3 TaxID=2828744 RepID=UPI002147FCAB
LIYLPAKHASAIPHIVVALSLSNYSAVALQQAQKNGVCISARSCTKSLLSLIHLYQIKLLQ